MFQEVIVATLIYIFIVGMLCAPKCPRYEAAGDAPVDYFPDALEEDEHTNLVDLMLEVFDPTPELADAHVAIAEPAIAITEPTSNLTDLTSKQLKAIAKEQKVKGWGSMTKAQLITAIAW